MVFERLFRSSSVPSPRFAFYGKLPFDREFLRFHLDGADARWLTSWVDGAHQLMAAHREAGGRSHNTELRFTIARDGGRSALVALIRPSTDGGGRSYPSCAFCVLPSAALQEAWHLSPLWLEPVWEAMSDEILGSGCASRKEFGAVLDRTVPQPHDWDAVVASFEQAAAGPMQGPWPTLTGVGAEKARSLAVTFVQLGRVQREAGTGRGGVAVRIPLNPVVGQPPLQAALWLRLFSAVAGVRSAWPAVVEFRPLGDGAGRGVCIFGREPTAEDLADLLSESGSAPIDDLGEGWDAEPDGEEDRRRIEALTNGNSTCLTQLWDSLDSTG